MSKSWTRDDGDVTGMRTDSEFGYMSQFGHKSVMPKLRETEYMFYDYFMINLENVSLSFWNRSMDIITAENAICDGRVPMFGAFRAPTR